MNKQTFPNLVNQDLTPTNAEERGYIFVQDVIDPYKAIQEIESLVQKKGYTFGISNSKDGKLGLYRKEK